MAVDMAPRPKEVLDKPFYLALADPLFGERRDYSPSGTAGWSNRGAAVLFAAKLTYTEIVPRLKSSVMLTRPTL